MRTLTARQAEIAALVAKGLNTPTIANRIGISPRTVDVHIQQAAARLGGAHVPPRQKLRVWFVQVIGSTREVA